MNFVEAERWAKELGANQIIALSTGETMILLPADPNAFGLRWR
jgi:hypothetical protein